jgi:hypothetical protein
MEPRLSHLGALLASAGGDVERAVDLVEKGGGGGAPPGAAGQRAPRPRSSAPRREYCQCRSSRRKSASS